MPIVSFCFEVLYRYIILACSLLGENHSAVIYESRTAVPHENFADAHLVCGTLFHIVVAKSLLVNTALNPARYSNLFTDCQKTHETCVSAPRYCRNIIALAEGAIDRQHHIADFPAERGGSVDRRLAQCADQRYPVQGIVLLRF